MSNPCSESSVSYAWVAPDGDVWEAGYDGHDEWAGEYVRGEAGLRTQVSKTVSPSDVLLQDGWVRVTNFVDFAVWDERTPSRAAWQTVLGLVRGCVIKDRGIDPFKPIVYLAEQGKGGLAKVYSISDIFEKFGGRGDGEHLFGELMVRVASNPCSTIAVSYAWVDPRGKVYECDSGGHAGWAEDYVEGHPELKVGDDSTDDLLFHGWIKVGNFTAMAVWNESTPSRQAWGAVVDLVRDCVVERRAKVDLFEEVMFVDSIEGGSQAKVYSISDFVEKFGGRRESEAMFESLATRVAFVGDGPVVINEMPFTAEPVPDGWRQPWGYFQPGDLIHHGKFQNKPGQIKRMFFDPRGIPMIEVVPVGHPRRKSRVISLYRVRHVDLPKRVASAYLSRVALEFDTKEEMEEYRKTHDIRKDTKLTVKKKEEGEGSSKAEPSGDAQAVGQKIMTGIKRPSGWRDPKDEQSLTAETRKEWEGEHTARTAKGSVVLGVTHMDEADEDSGAKSHSDATESASFKEHVLKEVDKAVKAAIKAGKKVVFLGEGGATSSQPYDEETLDDPNDWNEQHAVAKAIRKATGGKAKQDTWDDGPVDITKPDAEVWGRLTKAAGGNAVKAKGALAVFLAGQGDSYEGLVEQGWMNDEVADEVERATGIDLRKDVSEEDVAKMFQMAFPGDTGEPHNEVSAIGEVYNAARQEHLLSKIKAIESDPDGAVAIVAPGAGHAYQLKHALEGGKAGKSAGSLVQFPTPARAAPPPVRPKHTVTIGGRKYALSADGGPLGDQLVNELAGEDESGGARVVDMPYFMKPEPYRFLWVYDTEEGTVLMWRVTDGNNKVWGPADDFASKVWDLDKKGEMNRVTHTEMQKVDRAMRKREAEQLRSLKKWNADNASDYQKLVDEVAWDVFNRDVKPKLESRLREVKRGVTPIQFKVNERILDYSPIEDQIQGHVLGEEMQKFTVEKIEDEVRSRGVDPDAPGHDIQAAYWAHGDVTQAVWEKYKYRKSSASRVATQWLFAKRTKLGDCYEAAAKYVTTNGILGKKKDLVLVHGEVMGQGPLEGVTFGHAWVLDGGTVIDVSNGGNLRLPKSIYYTIGRVNEIGNTHEYTVEEARSHLLRYKVYGPWELKTRSGL